MLSLKENYDRLAVFYKSVKDKTIFAPEQSQEISVQHCLDDLGISLLSELDVFAFVYRHGASLTSSDQMAGLLGYERAVIYSVLDRLQHSHLIERSRLNRGIHLYRILASTDEVRRHSIQCLISLSETRSGRLFLAKQPTRAVCPKGFLCRRY